MQDVDIPLNKPVSSIAPPRSLDPPGHDLVDVSLEVVHAQSDAGLLAHAEQSQLSNVDIVEILPTYDVFKLLFLFVGECLRCAD